MNIVKTCPGFKVNSYPYRCLINLFFYPNPLCFFIIFAIFFIQLWGNIIDIQLGVAASVMFYLTHWRIGLHTYVAPLSFVLEGSC